MNTLSTSTYKSIRLLVNVSQWKLTKYVQGLYFHYYNDNEKTAPTPFKLTSTCNAEDKKNGLNMKFK